jgi:uncharacterized repeat protein (TIGR02543 family)
MRFDAATTILVRSLALILTASLTCGMAQAAAGPPAGTLEHACAGTVGAEPAIAAVRQPVATLAEPRTAVAQMRSVPESASGAGGTAPVVQYSLSLRGTGGSVAVDGSPHELPWSGAYGAGTTVPLEAVPDCCHVFWAWDFDGPVHENPISVTMDSDKEGTAHFCLSQHSLNLDGAHGSVRIDGVWYPLPWSISCICGSTVTLEAVPDAAYRFAGWSGDITGDQNPTTILVDSEKEITAQFVSIPGQHCLSITANDSGIILVDGVEYRPPFSVACDDGATVTLEARPREGHVFVCWSGDITGDENPTAILVDSEKAITVQFASTPCELSLSVAGDGLGTVLVDGVEHPLPSSVPCDAGAAVTLEAAPEEGYVFARWSGDLTDTDNPASITVDDDAQVTAHFDIASCSISVNARGEGAVALDGTTLELPWTGDRLWGTTLTLEAVPAPNGAFHGWSGDIAGVENPVTLQLDGDKHIWADFEGLFTDVPACHWAYDEIKACAAADIVRGYGDGSFQPDLAVDRAAMAVFLSRALCGGDQVPSGPRAPSFRDVLRQHWAYDCVEYLAACDVVAGYNQEVYLPGGPVTRDQMAVFIARCRGKHADDDGPADFLPPPEPTFADVPSDFWAHRHIEYLAHEHVVAGYPDGSYEPHQQVSRAQMAVFVQRAFQLPPSPDAGGDDATSCCSEAGRP